MHSPFKNRKASISSSESGIVVPIFAISLTMIMALFVFGIDGYMKLQTRIEQQNVAEYLSLAALHGFYEPVMDDTDFDARSENLIGALEETVSDNQILGWPQMLNFNNDMTCICGGCVLKRGGHYLYFGNYDQISNTFVQVPEIEPGICDVDSINAVMIRLLSSKQHQLLRFFDKQMPSNLGQLRSAKSVDVRALATTYTVGAKRIFRIMKNSATGTELEHITTNIPDA